MTGTRVQGSAFDHHVFISDPHRRLYLPRLRDCSAAEVAPNESARVRVWEASHVELLNV